MEILDNSLEHDSINNKNEIKFILKCCKIYNISLITMENFRWYNIHNQFISNGYNFLVVNCKFDIIIKSRNCQASALSSSSSTASVCTASWKKTCMFTSLFRVGAARAGKSHVFLSFTYSFWRPLCETSGPFQLWDWFGRIETRLRLKSHMAELQNWLEPFHYSQS